MKTSGKKQIHFIIQGKGGCGKSLLALILGMYFKISKKKKCAFYDIDQVNTTFTQYEKLDVKHLRITEADNINEINPRMLDDVVQKIIDTDAEVVVVDTGSNTFLNLLNYLVQNQIFDIFYGMDFSVYIHTVIVGSGDYNDTLNGAKAIIENLSIPVIIWVNEYFGPAIEKLKNSELNSDSYEHKQSILAYMLLTKPNEKLLGQDLVLMITNRLTLQEVESSEIFSFVSRIRIKKHFADVFAKLDSIKF
ncbi:hypothetical protein A3N57_07690 [Enterobacter cloacae subsp. dissolvens]|uniref:hypothetical protein n=1 Tax=Enterobacter cloacae complex TaxID=354276 RepID=UPI0007B342E0|nr:MULTISPECIES: hypothetical protein [Enterobacter cloacae complex]KZQ40637.1 hypothetical protein A3N57_07690 [Enterobacter cloacae subsp. dissolvens]MBE4946887.1 hypothetical protein [Enterobacter cloacae complex sp. P1B]MBE4971656.1 hypothetical protein [Enterobacter cloacae complex sp. P11RS]